MSITGFTTDLDRLAGRLNQKDASSLVTGIEGGLRPYFLAGLRERLDRLFVVVLPERRSADVLCQALNALYGERKAPVAFHYQAPDVSPFQEISPNRFLMLDRLAGLRRISTGDGVRYVVTSADALLHRTISRDLFEKATIHIVEEDELGIEPLTIRLVQAGYTRVATVEDPGTFAVRGGIVDVFSSAYSRPIRLDFYGFWVEAMRFFEVKTQRSMEPIKAVAIPPVREVVFSPENIERAVDTVGELAGDLCFPTLRLRPILDDIRSGIFSGPVEGVSPAFSESSGGLGDYVSDDALWVVVDSDAVIERLRVFSEGLEEQCEQAQKKGRLVFPVEQVSHGSESVIGEVSSRADLLLEPFVMGGTDRADYVARVHSNRDVVEALHRARGSTQPFEPLVQRIHEWREASQIVAIACATSGGTERLSGILRSYGVSTRVWDIPLRITDLASLRDRQEQVQLFVGALGQGFRFGALALVVLDESELLGSKMSGNRSSASTDPIAVLSSFRELRIGDFIVHLEHGVGRYDGLVKLQINEMDADFLHLTFHGDNRLYLPVHRLSRIQKYVGMENGAPRLDKLGGTLWEKTCGRVKKDLLEMAGDLVALQARRETQAGFAFSLPDAYFHSFSASFPYRETEDQQRAIDDVIEDMSRPLVMDRLVCGDVGYGKTEVAVRAAFKAVQDGKQVMILVPTTVLAEQHRLTLQDRFENHPVFVDTLSRFKTAKDQKVTIQKVAEGRIDVLIGTHRVLQDDIVFRDLGLLIIDEEHRFGVKAKEKMKAMKAQVDVLTLTATPIPRTLHMAMLGVRELSVIATPPPDRLSVRTIVARETEDFLVEAIGRELERGGQVFYVHNRVQTIGRKAEEIARLVPDARIAVGHGQMSSRALEKVMRGFVAGETNVLVCTTIIESGLDIPRANTLIVDRADRFGLADLYQLRGRVGRSNLRGYAYFMIPDPARLSGDAALRIGVLQRCADLGGGFQLATHDLEIRGAGNLLGEQQSGHIAAVGYEFYVEMLQEAMAELRGQEVRQEVDPELQIPVTALIPESYCPDTGIRLMFYKRLASALTEEEVAEIHRDIVDRCGRPPQEVDQLVRSARLKVIARSLGVTKLEFAEKGLSLTLENEDSIPVDALLSFLNLPGTRWRMRVDGNAIFRPLGTHEVEAGIDFIEEELRGLQTHVLSHVGAEEGALG